MPGEYRLFDPPISVPFAELSKKDMELYYHWFLEHIPIRVDLLVNEVVSTPGFASWRADYSPDSLDKLGEWLEGQIEIVEETPEEIAEEKASITGLLRELMEATNWGTIKSWKLSNRTFSLAMDVGIYFSQVLLRNHESLRWRLVNKGTKRYVYYGEPVITGFVKKGECSPVRLMVAVTKKIVGGKASAATLRELYNSWAGLVA